MILLVDEEYDYVASGISLSRCCIDILPHTISLLHKPVPGPVEEYFFHFILIQTVLSYKLVDNIRKPDESVNSHLDTVSELR